MSENLFESIKKVDKNGREFWMAREFAKVLGYSNFVNFEKVINKTKISLQNSGHKSQDHLADVGEVVQVGSGATAEYSSYKLSRLACYVIAQNSDPRKDQVALAQTYFAIKTRKQEVQENLIEDQKRVLMREDLKLKNKELASTASKAGVKNFANFQDHGYMGLYGGLRQKEIKKKKGLKEKDQLLDNVGNVELGANWFRITQADDKIKRERVFGQEKANMIHNEVGKEVRYSIKRLGGKMPEDLPKVEHIKFTKKKLKLLAKKTNKKLK